MESKKTPESGLFIPKNTFSAQEWAEIKQYAASIGVRPSELLAESWRDWCAQNRNPDELLEDAS